MSGKNVFEEAKREIIEKLKILDGEQINVCYQIYKTIISVQGREAELLRFLYENSEMIEATDNVSVEKIFSEDEERKLALHYEKLVKGILETMLQKKYAVDEFYQSLWNAIAENPMIEDEKAKVYAVYNIWTDPRIPYFELEQGIQMENEEFAEIIYERLEDIKKIRFIMTTPLEQRTERASLLLKVLDDIKDERERAVLMVQLMVMCGIQRCREREDETEA